MKFQTLHKMWSSYITDTQCQHKECKFDSNCKKELRDLAVIYTVYLKMYMTGLSFMSSKFNLI